MSYIWNVILNNELYCQNNVTEEVATSVKDSLLKKGNKEVSKVRFDPNGVKYIYTYKNIDNYRSSDNE